MKFGRYVALTLTAAAIGLGAYLSFEHPGPPVPAPDIGYTRLDGSTSELSQLRGRVVLMNFWATSCAVCVREMPGIVATHERFRARGFETIAVAMSYDAPASVVQFAQSRRLPFDVAIDNTGAIARGFGGIEATPTTLLLNKRGQIVRRYVGEPDFAALHRVVDQLLAET
ncbi:MAG: TlpA family protein disulfide reductase [Piscinibacter sp.]|nr:TlpA family protein disulfide reductase [Piscinibacter sp.]